MNSVQDFIQAYYALTSESPYFENKRVWDMGEYLVLTRLVPLYTHVEIAEVVDIPSRSASLKDFEPILEKIMNLADTHKVILTWPWEDVARRPLFEQEVREAWLIGKGFDVETQGSYLRPPKRHARQNEGMSRPPILMEIEQAVSTLVLGKFAEWYLSKSERSDLYFKSDVDALKDFMYANGVANSYVKNTLEEALNTGENLTPEDRFQLVGVLDNFESHIRELLNLGRLNFSKLQSGQRSHSVLIPNFEYAIVQVQGLISSLERNAPVKDIYDLYLSLIVNLGTNILHTLELYTIQEHIEADAHGELLSLASQLTPSQKESQENTIRFNSEFGELTLLIKLWHFKHIRVPNAALSLKQVGPSALSVEFHLDESPIVGWDQVLYLKQVIKDFVDLLSPAIFEGAPLPQGEFESTLEVCGFGGSAFGC